MATVVSKTSPKIDELLGPNVISGYLNSDGQLFLVTKAGSEILVGNISGVEGADPADLPRIVLSNNGPSDISDWGIVDGGSDVWEDIPWTVVAAKSNNFDNAFTFPDPASSTVIFTKPGLYTITWSFSANGIDNADVNSNLRFLLNPLYAENAYDVGVDGGEKATAVPTSSFTYYVSQDDIDHGRNKVLFELGWSNFDSGAISALYFEVEIQKLSIAVLAEGPDPASASRMTVFKRVEAADYASLGITEGSSGSFNILSWTDTDDPQVGTNITLNSPDDGSFNINKKGFYSISVFLKTDGISAARSTMDLRARTTVESPYLTLFDCDSRGGDADTGQSFPSTSRTYFHPGGDDDIYCTVLWKDFDIAALDSFIIEISIQELPGGPGPKGEPGDSASSDNSVPVGTTGYTISDFTPYSDPVHVYTTDDTSAVLFATKFAADSFPRLYFFVDPAAGIYWSDGTIDPVDGPNLFLIDNATMQLSGALRISNGPLGLVSNQNVIWVSHGPTDQGSVGDPRTDGTAPNLVGVHGFTTSARDSMSADITAVDDHYMAFDIDLGRAIWSDGAGGWVLGALIGTNVVQTGANSNAGGTSPTASGENSFAVGTHPTASGRSSFASGDHSNSSGDSSHAINGSIASGDSSFSQGDGSQAIGPGAAALGTDTMGIGQYCHVAGWSGIAFRDNEMSNGVPFGDQTLQRTHVPLSGNWGPDNVNLNFGTDPVTLAVHNGYFEGTVTLYSENLADKWVIQFYGHNDSTTWAGRGAGTVTIISSSGGGSTIYGASAITWTVSGDSFGNVLITPSASLGSDLSGRAGSLDLMELHEYTTTP